VKLLSEHNWPPAPGYYPQVVMEMHKDPKIIETSDFLQIVTQAYSRLYWDARLSFWGETNFFPGRQQYLKRAIDAYFEKDYIASIYVLVPQFEGIVRDYLLSCGIEPEEGFKNCVEQFKKLVFSRKILMFPREVIEDIFYYLKDGSFWAHTSKISSPTEIINRHGVLHGKFKGFECEEISLKYLILLDVVSSNILHDKMLTKAL